MVSELRRELGWCADGAHQGHDGMSLGKETEKSAFTLRLMLWSDAVQRRYENVCKRGTRHCARAGTGVMGGMERVGTYKSNKRRQCCSESRPIPRSCRSWRQAGTQVSAPRDGIMGEVRGSQSSESS